MTRIAIDLLIRRLQAAYRDDPFHALRRNIESVRPDEWDVRPEQWKVEEFGSDPELSVCDIVTHVAGAKFMYADRAFGSASLEWHDIAPPSREMAPMLLWLDEGHRALADGLQALGDDTELASPRPAPWRVSTTREWLLDIVISHDLYHSGEINRQRALIRGADGWEPH